MIWEQVTDIHTSVREAGRKDENIIFTPLVGENKFSSNVHELVHVTLQLPLATLDFVGTRSNNAVGSNLGGDNVTRSNSK